MNPTWWKGRNVLITGHTGFKGAWLCMLLHRLGANVHGFSTPAPTDPSLFHLARLDEIVTTTHGDVRDLESLRAAVKKSRRPTRSAHGRSTAGAGELSRSGGNFTPSM